MQCPFPFNPRARDTRDTRSLSCRASRGCEMDPPHSDIDPLRGMNPPLSLKAAG